MQQEHYIALGILIALVLVVLSSYYRRNLNKNYFNGKVILITGAANGLGHSLVQELLSNLYQLKETSKKTRLILLDRDQILLNSTKPHVEISSYQCNLADEVEVESFLASLGDVEIDLLINNAGIKQTKKLKDLNLTQFKQTYDVNVFTHFQLIHHFLKISSKKLQVVGIHSIMAHLPSAYLSDYCSSKAASFMLYDVLRQEENNKLDILSVCTYVIDTNMFKGAFDINQDSLFSERLRNFLFPPLKKEYVAKQILRCVTEKRKYLYLYKSLAYLPFLMRLFPTRLYDFCLNLGCGETSMKKISPD